MNGYRKELKFIVGDDILLDIRNRICTLMKSDAHQQGDFYRIRSVYFDSPTYTCYRENLAGISTREKYRIRTYDGSEKVINAEIKIRHRDTISKMKTAIDRDTFDALISGDTGKSARLIEEKISSSTGDDRRVFEKYLSKILTSAYRPACIVDYERSAYVYGTCNVRITFDRNVTASEEFTRMFDNALTGRPALDGNRHILEIKYDEYLPDEIKELLGGIHLQRNSSSKYALCLKRFI